MDTRSDTQPVTLIARLKQTWTELDYAQRRLFELRTGVPVLAPDVPHAPSAPNVRRQINELEALYAYEGPESASR